MVAIVQFVLLAAAVGGAAALVTSIGDGRRQLRVEGGTQLASELPLPKGWRRAEAAYGSVPHLSARARKPKALKTFQASLAAASSSSRQEVAVDETRLAIALREGGTMTQAASAAAQTATGSTGDTAYDGALLDFAAGLEYNKERFFGETVCYKMDLASGAPMHMAGPPDRSAAEEAYQHVLGQLLGAPLELYDVADEFGGELEVSGRSCYVWTSHQNQSMMLPATPPGEGVNPFMETAMNSFVDHLPMLGGPGGQQAAALRSAAAVAAIGRTSFDAGEPGSNHSGKAPLTTARLSYSVNATFCVTGDGEMLATNYSSALALMETQEAAEASPAVHRTTVLRQDAQATSATFARHGHSTAAAEAAFNAARGTASTSCVDLTRGTVGPKELHNQLNDAGRLARINSEADGHWEAEPYELWEETTVKEVVPTLGTKLGPLSLPLRQSLGSGDLPGGAMLLASASELVRVPPSFDARAHWPNCPSIGMVRNQGACGSCWAFAAVTVLADRFCVAAAEAAAAASASPRLRSQPQRGSGRSSASGRAASALESQANVSVSTLMGLELAPEHLVDCDGVNQGCQGGRLDDVWWFLRDHGVPSEACKPYRYCPSPNERGCGARRPGGSSLGGAEHCAAVCQAHHADTNPMELYRASIAYAVSAPSDLAALQRELLTHGPVEVGFFVFSDFHNYKRGVYFRTPGAYGPLGGHAVRLLGWGGGETNQTMPYWLAANSWSPSWGVGGFFKIRRGTNECGIETTPAAGLPRLERRR